MVEKIIEIKTPTGIILRGVLTLPTSKNITKLVISIAGFEQPGTAEEKFKIFGRALAQESLAFFRFDFSGLGISEGEFEHMTVERMSKELCAVIDYFRKNLQIEECKIIAHSLGTCVLAQSLSRTSVKIRQAILMAPALNQKELLRFWYVRKHATSHQPITWENYPEFLDEPAFQRDIQIPQREGKSHWIANDYYQENAGIDYTRMITKVPLALMHIHGKLDRIVPIESIILNSPQCIIRNGDHDLEKVSYREEWVSSAVKFFIEA